MKHPPPVSGGVFAHLDDARTTLDGSRTLAGWVAADKDYPAPRLRVEGIGETRVVSPTVPRADVANVFAARGQLIDELCGFTLFLPKEGRANVIVEAGDVHWNWLTISADEVPDAEDHLAELSEGIAAEIAKRRLKNVDEVLSAVVKLKFTDVVVVQRDQIETSYHFNSSERAKLVSVRGSLFAENCCTQIVQSVVSSGNFLSGLVNDRPASVVGSWLSYNSVNWALLHDGEEYFFVLQSRWYADAIYFPERRVLWLLAHISLEGFMDGVYWLRQEKVDAAPSRFFSEGRKLTSLLGSTDRPFHFYNEVAPALCLLSEAFAPGDLLPIYVEDGCDFFSLDAVTGTKVDQRAGSRAEVNEQNRLNHGFMLRVGIPYSAVSEDLRLRSDRRIRAAAAQCTSPMIVEGAALLRSAFPVIWIGITGQKRRWVEQVEGLALIVDFLARAFPGLHVLVDGWTAPLDPSDRDREAIAQDMSVGRGLLAAIKSPISHTILIGKDAAAKLTYAAEIDLFITNFGTGSIYPARFSEKAGIGHINPSFPRESHFHSRTHEIHPDHIKEWPAGESNEPDRMDYSIHPDIMLNALRDLLSKHDVVKDRLERLADVAP